ncbi:MAG: DUF547 domain-containing protein [Vicinamibacterales bacterium]
MSPTVRRPTNAVLACACACLVAWTAATPFAQGAFDHEYVALASLLTAYLRGARVDYAALKARRTTLDDLVRSFDAPNAAGEPRWTTNERLAFWINAYNVFTIRAIVDHYPIEGRVLSLWPRVSIRQIDGVWDTLAWKAAGRRVTLDEIEHTILRKQLKDPRIHAAVNCASIGCPPLAPEPFRARDIDRQLDAAMRRYFAVPTGLKTVDGRVSLSSVFKWYGDDFVEKFAPAGPADRTTPLERALLALVIRYGPPDAVRRASQPGVRVDFLDYDWSLNDVPR